jgi:hypothetical protein
MKNTSIRHADKSVSSDYHNEQEGSQKKSQRLLQGEEKNKSQESALNEVNEITRGYEPCLDTSISFQAVEDLPWQPSNLGEYRQLSLWKSTPTHSLSSDITSQEFRSTQISETTTQSQENSIFCQSDFLAQAQVSRGDNKLKRMKE